MRAEVTIPLTTPAGAHTIELRGVDPDGNERVVRFPITVEALAAAQTPRALPRTGFDPRPLTTAGIVLVVLGALLTALERPRRQAVPRNRLTRSSRSGARPA